MHALRCSSMDASGTAVPNTARSGTRRTPGTGPKRSPAINAGTPTPTLGSRWPAGSQSASGSMKTRNRQLNEFGQRSTPPFKDELIGPRGLQATDAAAEPAGAARSRFVMAEIGPRARVQWIQGTETLKRRSRPCRTRLIGLRRFRDERGRMHQGAGGAVRTPQHLVRARLRLSTVCGGAGRGVPRGRDLAAGQREPTTAPC